MVSAIQSSAMPSAPVQSRVSAPAARDAAAPVTADMHPAVVMPPPKAEIQIDTEKMRANLQEAIGRINEMMRDGGRGLNFSMDDKLGRPVVLVRNLESGEVIRQIPNEVVVKVAHSIEDLKGMLHNEAV